MLNGITTSRERSVAVIIAQNQGMPEATWINSSDHCAIPGGVQCENPRAARSP